MFGQTSVVSFLIENGASLNIQNNQGSTALLVAAFFGHPEAVRLLLAGGTARDIRNYDGLTPLDTVSGPWSREGGGGNLRVLRCGLSDGTGHRSDQGSPLGSKRYPSKSKLTPHTRVTNPRA